MPQRHYSFERCFGFRDLGGYLTEDGRTVRWGRLFRSMTPQFMTEAGVSKLRDELGVRTIVDLRREETAKAGPFQGAPFRRRVVPFVTAGPDAPHDTPRDVIVSQVFERSGSQAVEAIEFIASAAGDSASLFHCYTGKDRTGVLAAVILRLLGVSEADVLEDYLLSAPAVAEMRAYAAAEGMFFFPELPETAQPFVMEPPQAHWLAGVAAALRQPNDARDYLMAHGASQETLERFRARMLGT